MPDGSCAKCGKAEASFRCGNCKSVFYCSDEHASIDWQKHHSVCKLPLADSKNIGLAMEAERELIALNAFKNKNPPGPFYFVMYGPPGSGKSATLSSLLASMSIPSYSLIRVLIDEYIEQFTAYSEPLAELKKAWKAGELPVEQYIDQSEALYWKVRSEAAEIVEVNVLQRARENKYHVLKETTGGSVSSLLEKATLFSRSGYQTLLIYPFVTKATLIQRIAARAGETGRFPDPKKLETQIRQAQENFLKIYDKFDVVTIIDNEKVFGEGGVLVHRTNTTALEKTDPSHLTQCNVRQTQQYIADGSLIPEFSDFIKENC